MNTPLAKEQREIQLRREAMKRTIGRGDIKGSVPRFEATLKQLVEQAFIADGGTGQRPQPPSKIGDHAGSGNVFSWGDSASYFGQLAFTVTGFSVGPITRHTLVSCAPLTSNVSQAAWVGIRTTASLKPGVKMYISEGPNTRDMTDQSVPEFRVQIDWVPGRGHQMPHTRERHKDNFHVTLVQEDGTFVDLQVWVVTRGGKFYFLVQEGYSGQVIRTTQEQADQLGNTSLPYNGGHRATVVPLRAQHAYPGADFIKSNPGGENIVRMALEAGYSAPLSKCTFAEWTPPGQPDQQILDRLNSGLKPGDQPWVCAHQYWFNAGLGYGFCCTTDDSVMVKTYMTGIIRPDGSQVMKTNVPWLMPMANVYVRVPKNPDDRGCYQAIAVRAS